MNPIKRSSSEDLVVMGRVLGVTVLEAASKPACPIDSLVGKGRGHSLTLETWGRETEPLSAIGVLCDVTVVEKGEPTSHINIIKVEIAARVGLIASYDTRW
jgi:hypothetical protein